MVTPWMTPVEAGQWLAVGMYVLMAPPETAAHTGALFAAAPWSTVDHMAAALRITKRDRPFFLSPGMRSVRLATLFARHLARCIDRSKLS